MSTSVPLKTARLVTLLATSVFACVAACIGLNAIIRSHQSQTRLKKLAPAGTVLEIDVSDITNVGIVATVGNILMGLFAFVFFNLTLIPSFRALANKTVRLQAAALAFSVVWVFAPMIPFMIWYKNDSAALKAFVGQIQLPDSLVQSMVAKSGHSAKFSTMWYLRLLAIFPWLSIASALVATAVLFKASSASAAASSRESRISSEGSLKESVTHNEKVENV